MTFRASLPWMVLLLVACGESVGRTPQCTDGGESDGVAVTLVAPMEGATVSGAVELRAEVKGAIAATVEFFVDGKSVGTSAAAPYTLSWDSEFAPAGEHLVEARVGSASDSARVIVAPQTGADQFPTIRFLSPGADATVCGTIPLEAAASDDAGIQQVAFFVDGEILSTVTVQPYRFNWSTADFPNGRKFVTAIATDSAGQRTQATLWVTIKNDGAACDNPPSVVITQPSTSFVTNSASAVLEATANDDQGVVKVQFFIDNGIVTEDTSVPFRTNWNPADFGEGVRTLKVIAYDTKGQTATATKDLIIDFNAPTVTLVSPQDGASIPAGPVVLTANASDTVGIDRVEFSLDGANAGSAATSPYSVTLNQLSPGPHRVQAVAFDKAGNSATSETVSFAYGDGPSIKILTPKGGETIGGTVRITAQASAPGGIQAVQFTSSFFAPISAIYDWNTNTWVGTWDGCAGTNGTGEISATVTDRNNVKATDTVQVALSNPRGAPLLTGTAQGQNVSLSWSQCPTAANYRLFWSRQPNVTNQSQWLPVSGTTYTQNVQNPGLIYFRVASVQGNQVGTLSNELTLNLQSTCSSKYDCSGGQICEMGACVAPPTSCTRDDQCPAGGYCRQGRCAPGCATNQDCNQGQTCNTTTRFCETPRCSDAICQQQFGPRAYCDAAANQCKQYQCLQNGDCPQGQTCDASTKTCAGGGSSCDFTGCNQTCLAQNKTCEFSSCTCQAAGTSSGMAMKQDGSSCSLTDCFSAQCVDSGNPSKRCDPWQWQACLASLPGNTTACQ